MNEQDRKFFLDSLFKIKFVPHKVADTAEYHVCSDHPVMNCVNYAAACCGCGRPVFYSVLIAAENKICPGCARQRCAGKPVELMTVDNPMVRAVMRHFSEKN